MLASITVHNFNLQRDIGHSVAEFGPLGREYVGIDFVGHAEIQQFVLLIAKLAQFLLQEYRVFLRTDAMIRVPFSQRFGKPRPHLLRLLDAAKDRQDLLIKLRFGHAVPGMIFQARDRAAIVDVCLAGLGFDDLFAGNEITAVTAANQSAGVGELVGFVGLAAQQCLHAIPCATVDQRFMLAGIPLPLVFDLPDVSPVQKDVVNAAAGKQRHVLAELAAFGVHFVNQSVEGQRLECEQFKHPPYVVSGRRIDFNKAPAVLADVAVTIGCFTQEPTFLNAAGVSLPHIH